MGFNYRLSNINAALGLAQAENLKAILVKKNEIHNSYKNTSKRMRNLKSWILLITPEIIIG